MKPDLYTKTVLTLIAVLLVICVVRLPVATVRAENFESDLRFDPDVHQIDVPGGSASPSGRIAIDIRTGDVYGFPTNGAAYPRNLQSNALAISKPILLGRFDFGSIHRH